MTDIDMDTFDYDNEAYEDDDIIDTNIDEDQDDKFITPRTSDRLFLKQQDFNLMRSNVKKLINLLRHLGISKYDSQLIDLSRINTLEKDETTGTLH